MADGKVSNLRKGPAAAAAERPTDAIIRAATTPQEVTDSLGRKLMVRRPGALEKLRLFKAIGGENSKNEIYLGYATLAISVTSIDGQPMEPCKNEAHVEALVSELGDEGIEAVAAAFATDEQMSQKELVESARNFT